MKSHIKQNQLRKNLQTTPYHDILVCPSSWVCPKAFTTASFSSAMEAPLGTWISAIMKRYFQIEITSKQSLTYNYMQSSGFPISIPKQEPSSLRTDSLRSCWGSFWYEKLSLMPQSSGWGEDEDAIPHMQASKNTGPRPGIMWKPLLQNILSIRIWVCVFSFFSTEFLVWDVDENPNLPIGGSVGVIMICRGETVISVGWFGGELGNTCNDTDIGI